MNLHDLTLLSEDLRLKALILKSREVLLPQSVIARVLWELAMADRVILGYDIIIVEGGGPSIHGQTDYDDEVDLDATAWSQCVLTSLRLALRDLGRLQDISGLKPPHDDVWYAVSHLQPSDWDRMRLSMPRDKDGRFVLGTLEPRPGPAPH